MFYLPNLPSQPTSILEMAESFTTVVLDAVEADVLPSSLRTPKLG